jgi:hypothetical protein
MPSRDPAHGLWAGSASSRWYSPQCPVTLQVWSAMLLVGLGLLLGATWTIQALQPKLRRQAEERRRLNEEWSAVRTARRQRGACPRCATPLSEQDWYFGPTLAEDPADDDPDRAMPALVRGSLQNQGKSSSEPVRSPVAREPSPSHNGLTQTTTLPITIYLSDESAHEQVEAAVEDLLAAAGGHIEHRDDPVFGSWFRRMRARTDQAVHSPLAREAAIVAAHAAESRLVHAQDATITATMLQNLGPVLAALHPTKDAVIRAGALLIVKVDWIVAIHQLTPAQQLQLDHQPQLAQSPHDILSALERRTGNSTPSAEGVDGTCGSTTVPRSLNGNPAPLTITSNNGEGSTPLNAADHQVFPEASAGA